MLAQDSATVTFERRFAMPTLDWQTVIKGLVLGVAVFALYRFLAWLVAKRQAQTGWKATRYLWPAAMLVAQWTTYLIMNRGMGALTWRMGLLLSALGCLFWWAAIRLLEWFNELTAPTTLDLSGSSRK